MVFTQEKPAVFPLFSYLSDLGGFAPGSLLLVLAKPFEGKEPVSSVAELGGDRRVWGGSKKQGR